MIAEPAPSAAGQRPRAPAPHVYPDSGQGLRQSEQLRMRVLTSLEAENYSMPWQKPLTDERFVANLYWRAT